MSAEQDRFQTRAVHAGLEPDPTYGSVIPPIHQTSTFAQRGVGRVRRGLRLRALGEPDARGARDARSASSRAAWPSSFSSGMAATHALLTAACSAGDHIVIPTDLYGGTYRLVDKVLARWGLRYTMVDQTDLDALAAAVTDATRLIWVETPTNPLLNVVDIAGVVARKRDALVVVDNTFATPVNQRPLELGADAVVHSVDQVPRRPLRHGRRRRDRRATRRLHEQVRFVQNAVGAVPGAVRLLPRAPRPAHAAAADARARRERRGGRRVPARAPTAPSDVRWPGFSGMVSFRHPDAIAHRAGHAPLHAGRVAGRRRVADRGAPGDDPPVRRGLRRRRARRPRAPVLRRRGPADLVADLRAAFAAAAGAPQRSAAGQAIR